MQHLPFSDRGEGWVKDAAQARLAWGRPHITGLEHIHMQSRWVRAFSPCREAAQLWAIEGPARTSISKKFDKYLLELI